MLYRMLNLRDNESSMEIAFAWILRWIMGKQRNLGIFECFCSRAERTVGGGGRGERTLVLSLARESPSSVLFL